MLFVYVLYASFMQRNMEHAGCKVAPVPDIRYRVPVAVMPENCMFS